MTFVSKDRGLILLRHPVHCYVHDEEMVDVLTPEQLALPRHVVTIDALPVTIEEAGAADWSEMTRAQEAQIAERLRPLLAAHSGYRCCYFGAAPIPLAVHLGATLGGWAHASIFLRHHDRRDWRWDLSSPAGGDLAVRVSGVPSEPVRAEGDLIVRVATSHPIDAATTREAVPHALAEVDLNVAPMSEDAFRNDTAIEDVARAFRRALDETLRRRPGARRVHLFASVQVGVAFALGRELRASLHPPVQTYHYARTRAQRQLPAIRIFAEELPRDGAAAAAHQDARPRGHLATRPARLVLIGVEADGDLMDALQEHLALDEQRGELRTERIDRLLAGSNRIAEARRMLETADLVLVFTRAALFDSKEHWELVERALEATTPPVVPVLCAACKWESTGLGELQAIPRDGRPITEARNREPVVHEVAERIREVLVSRATPHPGS